MKYIPVMFLFMIGTVFAVSCDVYTMESTCEDSDCFWCEKCSFNQLNTFGEAKCVETSVDCLYECSTVCGSNCGSAADCEVNLTETDCFYDGTCSGCECAYKQEKCPKPGAYEGRTCYYGERNCNENGCTIKSCIMLPSETCSPADGCVYCGQDYCGNSGEFNRDYECRNDDVWAEQVKYYCNATACSYEERAILVEKCDDGCNLGACKSGLCNLQGTEFNCNELDGFYGNKFCMGDDVYSSHRDYKCVEGKCEFTSSDVKRESCEKCESGLCVTEEPTNDTTTITPTIPTEPVITGPYSTFNKGGTVYNGFLFGQGKVIVDTEKGVNGVINFSITRTNRLGTLQLRTGDTLLEFRETGSHLIPLTNIGSTLEFSVTSSGWFFFAPSTYSIGNIILNYG